MAQLVTCWTENWAKFNTVIDVSACWKDMPVVYLTREDIVSELWCDSLAKLNELNSNLLFSTRSQQLELKGLRSWTAWKFSFWHLMRLQHCNVVQTFANWHVRIPWLRSIQMIEMPSILVLDNGLRKISNLNPVSLSLQVLCLCDQVIRT